MRKHYLDNLRTLVVLLVVGYHVIYMFNAIATAGVVGPIGGPGCLDAVLYLLYPWFMVILFLVSGICARYYLAGHTVLDYLRTRTQKLLVPSTIGVLVFGWAQGAVNMLLSHAFDNLPSGIPGPVFYLILCVSGTGVLWTIQVLWVCTVALLLVRKLVGTRWDALGRSWGIPALVLLGVPVWGAAQLLNPPIITVYRFGIYIFTFLLGYYVFSQTEVTDRLRRAALPLLVLAAALGAVYTYINYGSNYAVAPAVNSPLAIAYGWVACLAVLGGMKRFADRTTPAWQWLAKRSFGLYVFHYLPLSAAAYGLVHYTRLPAGAVYVLTAAAAYWGGWGLYAVFSRVPVLRWCVLGIAKPKGESTHVPR